MKIGMKLYKYTSAKCALDFLRKGKIKVVTLDDVNDPNERPPFISSLAETDGMNVLYDRYLRAGFKMTYRMFRGHPTSIPTARYGCTR